MAAGQGGDRRMCVKSKWWLVRWQQGCRALSSRAGSQGAERMLMEGRGNEPRQHKTE